MFYKSTRDSSLHLSSAEAIVKGISDEGGLFVPSEIPSLTLDEIVSYADLSYPERAARIFSKFLTDFTDAELRYCTESAYNDKSFDHATITETAHLFDGTYILELWHGPTCAFKDMALQILPYLLTTSLKKLSVDKKVVILVATSGDTGKAALEGFADVEGTTFKEYLTRVRIHHASAMLIDGGFPLEEIMKQCGFTNTATFYRVFKRNTGYSPRQYHNRFAEQKDEE
ncbi:MAG: helix-turn-helix domain-containing protein [Oscillospiraceae bacterium]|nr:helix-turn-helix domain-containing protein [Oscillospiraceae bacterium]